MKKTPGDIIILQKWTKNHDQMLYCSWDTVHDGCNYFLLKANFCTFTPLTAWKMKLKKKMEKNPGDIIILHKCTKNQDHMLYCSWDMAHHRYNCYFSFWTILYPFTLLTAPKKEDFTKMKKTPGDVIILHKCTKNHDYVLYCSWDMVRDRCNYFSFWANFCPFTPLTAWKMKIFKKWKNP